MAMQGDDMKALRKAAGMTQGQLGEAIGLTLGFIGEMERGEKPVELRTELAMRYVLEQRQHQVAPAITGQGQLATMNLADLTAILDRRYSRLAGV